MSFLMAFVSDAFPQPRGAKFGGDAVVSNGSQLQVETTAATFTSEGVVSNDGGLRLETRVPVIMILDDTIYKAPTALTFMVTGGWPDDDVEFAVDGTPLLTTKLDSTGVLGATSISISEAIGTQGTHLLGMTSLTVQAGYAVYATFTIESPPSTLPVVIGQDADPVEIPGAQTPSGVYKWVLQDLMPGGLGSYVMPQNPVSMSSPHFQRTLSQEHTTSVRDGVYHIAEVGITAVEWQFAGTCLTQAFYDKLVQYYELPRRFYVIDHRNRAWTVAFTSLDFKARLRTNVDGSLTDWVHDYTVTALVYDQNWKVPQ